jgi:hypothetical protein
MKKQTKIVLVAVIAFVALQIDLALFKSLGVPFIWRTLLLNIPFSVAIGWRLSGELLDAKAPDAG